MSLARAKLTSEEEEFYRLLLVRATSEGIGQPYLSYALFELTPVAAPGLKTMAVDKLWRVYIDFEWAIEKGVVYAAQVLNHEPWHLLRRHADRFDDLSVRDDGKPNDPKTFNVAGDLTINGDIVNLVPEDGCFPEKGIFKDYLFNETAETYYTQLLKDENFNPKPQPCPECGKTPGESGEGQESSDSSGDQDSDSGSGEGQESSDGSGKGQESSDGSGKGQDGSDGSGKKCSTCDGHGNPKPGNGVPTINCGSGAGNKLKEYEDSLDGDVKKISPEEAEQIRQGVAEAIKDYALSNPGSVPGSSKVWADQTLTAPSPDWRSILRGSLKQSISWKRGQLDYNRARRNRRQPNRKIISPALVAPKPRIAVGIDTSGSHLHKLGIVVDQIVEIVKQVGVRDRELSAFGVDVRATTPKFVPNPKHVLDNIKGGGGTDMCVAYEVFEELDRKNKADISILLTDLQTGWPATRPAGSMKHIVCGIVDSRTSWEMEWINKAEKAIGSWATIVIIDIAEGDNK